MALQERSAGGQPVNGKGMEKGQGGPVGIERTASDCNATPVLEAKRTPQTQYGEVFARRTAQRPLFARIQALLMRGDLRGTACTPWT